MARCMHCLEPIIKSDDGSRWLHDDNKAGYLYCHARTVAWPIEEGP